jgi:hypothetical protein
MSKFKAGDEVRAIRDTHSDSERHTASTQFVVGEKVLGLVPGEFSAGPVEAPNRYIFPEVDFELVLDPSKEVAAPSATEATRLDPGAVKAGDYIEAESDGTGIKGPVLHINENGYVSIQHLGSFAIEGITTKDTGYRLFTLTDHQPAPEPEPEWSRAADYVATVRGIPGVRVTWSPVDDGDSNPWRTREPITDEKHSWHPESEVTDVHPLVVIDPATVSKDILATKAFTSVSVVERVLEQLGLSR